MVRNTNSGNFLPFLIITVRYSSLLLLRYSRDKKIYCVTFSYIKYMLTVQHNLRDKDGTLLFLFRTFFFISLTFFAEILFNYCGLKC
jgi:hypothetical protein